MPIEHSEAIVIRTVEFSETSLVLTLFTRDFGKVRGIAKGARQLKNSFDSSLDLLTRISVSLIRKNSDALDLLTEAKLIRRFRLGSAGIPGLYAGYYLAELLLMMTEEGDPMPELYDRAAGTLARFEEGKQIEEQLVVFPWELMALSGERPSTGECVACGNPIPFEREIRRRRRIGFSMPDGGAVCADCQKTRGFRQLAAVDPRALYWLDRLGEAAAPALPEEAPLRREIESLTDWMVDAKCGRVPKTRNQVRQALAEQAQNQNPRHEESQTDRS